MNESQIELVQASFEKVLSIADAAAQLFYTRLFQIDPKLRGMFGTDMTEQRKKLMDALRVVVTGLRNLDRTLPMLTVLGRRHAQYGVRNEHYATVGEALIDTLRKGLGDAFTDEVCEAWLAAFSVIANTMMNAAATAKTAEYPAISV